MQVWRVVVASAAVGASLAAQAPGQFRVSTDLVSVYATVQERSGRLVPDLRQEDFTILDDGREQPIALFSNEVSAFSVVVMLDRSGSMMSNLGVIKEAASAFVGQMRPGDRARIGAIGNRITILPPDFTSSHEALRDALARPLGDGSSPVWLAVDQSITALYEQPGRRVILLLSDGHDEPSAYHPQTPFKGLIDRVKRSGVMIYAVGFASSETRDGRPRRIPPRKELRELAAVGGGGYFEMSDTADLKSLFGRVADELHRQYWIGFEPQKRDGKLHSIQVRVKRPGMTVRARQSYLAPSAR